MAEYISTFTTGFSEIIPKILKNELPEAKIVSLLDGLVYYRYSNNESKINQVFVFNNNYRVIRSYNGEKLNLKRMAGEALRIKKLPRFNESFRVRYSANNQFVAMDKNLTRQIESKISKETHGKIERLNPQTEYWFLLRRENIGFFCRLLRKREKTEKNLHKGELRPELAYLICNTVPVKSKHVIMDPFAGYGAIPNQIIKHLSFQKLYVSDIDKSKIENMTKGKWNFKDTIDIACRDALNMVDIRDNSIDIIITDPPWGIFDNIGDINFFYHKMMDEFCRVLKADGKLVILSARKRELEDVINEKGLYIYKKLDTLVNGKKASVYVMTVCKL